MEDAIRSVGQNFSSMGGGHTIRKMPIGDIDFRIQRQLKQWGKQDDPPARVKPIPVKIIILVLSITFSDEPSEGNQAVADMIFIAFFYFLRPGGGVQGHQHRRCFLSYVCCSTLEWQYFRRPPHGTRDTNTLSHVGLPSLYQAESGVCVEVINHACSGATRCCPVRALAHHIFQHTESSVIPIASYYYNNHKRAAKAQDITSLLRQAVRRIGPDVDICENNVLSRSLHAGGAMALLCAQVDDNIIKLIGRW
jgi:hypothetical protein